MLPSLPDLAPRDSHALWFTPSHWTGVFTIDIVDANANGNGTLDSIRPPGYNGSTIPARHPQHNVRYRSPLKRLLADESYVEHRKHNVQNYGSSWIKPPGVTKSLHQIREDRREMEEHHEALRREQLAQELAEAEAGEEHLQGEGGTDQIEDMADLDDEIPEADITGLDADESDEENEAHAAGYNPRPVLAQRLPEEAFREALVRGNGTTRRGYDEELVTARVEESQILQEEDLAHEHSHVLHADVEVEVDMDMEVDLDRDVAEVGSGLYEHTDTELETSSSEEDISIGARYLPPQRLPRTSMVRSDGTQNSIGPRDALSGSSVMSSSPGLGNASSSGSRRQRSHRGR